jgi:hypothetical protein
MELALEQNYPNPSNQSTKIGFTIHVPGFTTREVRTVVSEELKVGSYETTFDAKGLASGVYFYRWFVGPSGGVTENSIPSSKQKSLSCSVEQKRFRCSGNSKCL